MIAPTLNESVTLKSSGLSENRRPSSFSMTLIARAFSPSFLRIGGRLR